MPTDREQTNRPFMQRDVTVRGVIGACLVTLVLGACISLVTIFVVNQSVSNNADKIEALSLSNCSTVNRNTEKLVQLVDILGTIVAGGALGPDAKINVEEPRLLLCKEGGKLQPPLKHPEKRTYTAPEDAPPLPNPQK